MKRKLKKIILLFLFLSLLGIITVFSLSQHIKSTTRDKIHYYKENITPVQTIIVLGASVKSNGNLSVMLRDRVESALQLFENGKGKYFLLSGDNGSKHYNEPLAMKKHLLERGVPEEVIYLDYAGFDTYDSMYRSKAVFEVTDAVVVTQKFHLPRALYIANDLGLNYQGYVGDKRNYRYENSNKKREILANVKAFLELKFGKEPTFLGNKVPISGPPQSSYNNP